MDWIKRSASLGLGAALAFVLAASGWLHGGVSGDLASEERQREAILLANAISASLGGADAATAARHLQRWQGEHAVLESARLVVGRELVASTRDKDGAPRALQREEKPLFDLANELRAAGETNVGEGAVRKKTVRVDGGRSGPVTVSVPYRVEGKVEGMLQAVVRPGAPQGSASPADRAAASWTLPLGLLAAAFVAGAFLRVHAQRRFDIGRGVALVLLLAAGVFFQHHRLGQMAEGSAASEARIAKLQAAAAATHARTGVPAPGGPASPWDTDAYGRALGLVAVDGQPLSKAAAALDSHARFLQRSFWAILLAGAGLLLFFVQGQAARTARALAAHRVAYAYIAPAMIGMLVLVFFPFFYGIALAFTDTTLFNEQQPFRERWIGLGNFLAILGDFDIVKTTAEGTVVNYQNFYWTLAMTVIWTVTNVAVGVTFGFLLALALNTEGFKGKTIYRVLLILPWAIPNYITALVWRGMFHPQFGVINQFLQMVGLEPVRWFDGVVSSFMTGLITNGWLSFPFMMVVILGALQSIPRDMYEAAEVEGATRWQQFRRLTLPLLRPTLVPAVVLSVVWTFNMFNIIFLVSGGEPGGANEILITKAYKIAFEQYQYAYAAAYSTVIFIILLAYGYFQTRVTRATESY
jgi:arabinogalactan oligomer/maltooligosaccharide transport system permease protein